MRMNDQVTGQRFSIPANKKSHSRANRAQGLNIGGGQGQPNDYFEPNFAASRNSETPDF
jgi:hypothetical protein